MNVQELNTFLTHNKEPIAVTAPLILQSTESLDQLYQEKVKPAPSESCLPLNGHHGLKAEVWAVTRHTFHYRFFCKADVNPSYDPTDHRLPLDALIRLWLPSKTSERRVD